MHALLVSALWLAVPLSAAAEPPSLDYVLERMSRVASLYQDAALRFTCEETIRYRGSDVSELHRFHYIYRYSDESGKLQDYRTLWGKSDEPPEEQEKARLQNYGLPNYLLRAYSWVFVFKKEYQPLYEFTFEGFEEALHRDAMRIGFFARPPLLEGRNEWVGTMWIDRETYQLLRVEANLAREYDQVERLRQVRDEGGEATEDLRATFIFSDVTTEFDLEHNGMRFPGRVIIDRNAHQVTGRKRRKAAVDKQPIYRIVQTYHGYRFFGVRTAEQIQEIVEGD